MDEGLQLLHDVTILLEVALEQVNEEMKELLIKKEEADKLLAKNPKGKDFDTIAAKHTLKSIDHIIDTKEREYNKTKKLYDDAKELLVRRGVIEQ